jgi:hypothetical protein
LHLLAVQSVELLGLFESLPFKWFCQYTLNYICIVYNIELLITDFRMTRMKAGTSEHFSFVVITERYIFIHVCVLSARRTNKPDLRIRDEILHDWPQTEASYFHFDYMDGYEMKLKILFWRNSVSVGHSHIIHLLKAG